MKKCIVAECEKLRHNHGKLCGMHSARWVRTASLELKQISPKEKFMARVQKTKSCWLWKGPTLKGYGRFHFNRKTYTSNRAAYILFKGEIPHGLIVCHSCDNPSCVNPDHLWLGTNNDNCQDKMKKGRHVPRGKKHEKTFNMGKMPSVLGL